MVKQRTPGEEHLMIRKQIAACPHCGERIFLMPGLSAGSQRYIEDC